MSVIDVFMLDYNPYKWDIATTVTDQKNFLEGRIETENVSK